MSEIVKFVPPVTAVDIYPDSDRYKGGFSVRSSSSNNKYKISFDTAMLCWKCSCKGCIRWGQCKHLDACGLKGRTYGRQINEAKKYGWIK